MNVDALSKVAALTTVEISQNAALSEEALALPTDGNVVGAFLGLLLEQGLDPDALRFIAHALPKREAVWWACQCVRAVASDLAPAVASALDATERWVAEPNEENRREAGLAAEAAGVGEPAGCAAMAAFWSGGSLGPANLPDVPPGDDLTGRGVAGAVLLAAVSVEPERAPEKFRQFVKLGLDVAEGNLRWNDPSTPAPDVSNRTTQRTSATTRVFDTWE
ncbi:MAG: hypothetical protein ABI353_19840 [Isosphaeraceae bacterium]